VVEDSTSSTLLEGHTNSSGHNRACNCATTRSLFAFDRGVTEVEDYGVELERAPLLEHFERAVPRPELLVDVPAIELFFEDLVVMTPEPVG